MKDPLSELLRTVRLTGGVFLDARFTAPWCISAKLEAEDCAPFLAAPTEMIAYHLVIEGRVVVEVEGERPIEVTAGEVVLLPRNDVHRMGSDPGLRPVPAGPLIRPGGAGELARIDHGGGGPATRMVCGFLGSEQTHNPLIATLPRLLKLDIRRGASRDWVEASMRFAAAELAQGRLASSDVMSRLSELLLVEAVRSYAATLDERDTGWLRGLADPHVARALALVHGDLAAPWSTEGLARAAGMSRSAFIDRFASLVGVPPIRYVTLWRLQTAKIELRETEAPVAQVANRVGYESEEAFSRAFKREFGMPPARWREAGEAAPRAPATAAVLAEPAPEPSRAAIEAAVVTPSRRASIAVMPFLDRSGGARGGMADALAHDVITRLAKLRSLFVIAEGSVFALHDRRVAPDEAGRMLKVDYLAAGSIRRQGKRLTVTVELTEAQSARIVWTEIFEQAADDAFLVLDAIGNRIVASIASEIETIERNRAILKPPSTLDAWEAHHRGLWHMYRFNREDNGRARHFFETAVRLDPTFARAYAGLSFTHFQTAFQGWEAREPEIERAYAAASQSLMADDRDPAAHWAMGRAMWLRGRHGESVGELRQAIDLSPNFALGHYTLAFVESQAGDAAAAIAASDHSRNLSPFDPLLFGMMGARSMALVRLGRFDEAAEWGVKAAARPNAHAHIHAIAAYALALADREQEGRERLTAIRRELPGYGVDDFLTAMRISPDGVARYREAARLLAATD